MRASPAPGSTAPGCGWTSSAARWARRSPGDYAAAQASYLALEQNFKSIGSQDAASWAYKRGRRMGRLQAGAAGPGGLGGARRARTSLRHGYQWVADRFVEWLCDYGESLSRIARAFVILIFVFAALYGLDRRPDPGGGDGRPTYNPLDLVSYSALNMMTANPPEIGVKPVGRVTNLLVGHRGRGRHHPDGPVRLRSRQSAAALIDQPRSAVLPP